MPLLLLRLPLILLEPLLAALLPVRHWSGICVCVRQQGEETETRSPKSNGQLRGAAKLRAEHK